jgi:EAL domain-containing protein (putative c-di-GMP-specific phosphodiesterase class I)/GGDEF domain-containing protein
MGLGGQWIAMLVPTFRQLQEPVGEILRSQGALAALVIDFSRLARIERSFGASAYQLVRDQITPLLAEAKSHLREQDLLARDEPEGDRFVVFLAGRRHEGVAFDVGDLRRLADRIEDFLNPRIGRLTLPYLRERPSVSVGYGIILYSRLVREDRQVLLLIDEAMASADLRERVHGRAQRESLIEIILNKKIWTAFQPLVELGTGKVMGYEGLSRGPRGSDVESPTALFGLAGRHGLSEELERACRRQAFVDWDFFGSPARLFVNTIPATVRDSSFLGRGVLDYLGPNLSPRMVTLEITEHEVIQNMSLYREAMHSFLELGFTFAIDDLGAGYSGLESLANLGATFLKIDMGLVRDVHQRKVSQQVVKAIVDLGQGVGATVIAEGIETQDEADTLIDLGLHYGQGYLFGRPMDPRSAVSKPPRAASGR